MSPPPGIAGAAPVGRDPRQHARQHVVVADEVVPECGENVRHEQRHADVGKTGVQRQEHIVPELSLREGHGGYGRQRGPGPGEQAEDAGALMAQ
jgi:hypothetical protein